VQVVPVKPTLKPLEIKRLKLYTDELVSSFAFKFNLRRYTVGVAALSPNRGLGVLVAVAIIMHKVGRCRLTLSNPL
jgi:hypothetical protein